MRHIDSQKIHEFRFRN